MGNLHCLLLLSPYELLQVMMYRTSLSNIDGTYCSVCMHFFEFSTLILLYAR